MTITSNRPPDREFQVGPDGEVETLASPANGWGTRMVVTAAGNSIAGWPAAVMHEATRLRLEWEERPRLPEGWEESRTHVYGCDADGSIEAEIDVAAYWRPFVYANCSDKRIGQLKQAQAYARWKAGSESKQ